MCVGVVVKVTGGDEDGWKDAEGQEMEVRREGRKQTDGTTKRHGADGETGNGGCEGGSEISTLSSMTSVLVTACTNGR